MPHHLPKRIFTPRPLAWCLGFIFVSLTGCQSIPTKSDVLSNRSAFLQYQQSQSAKAEFDVVMARHLAQERVSVARYYQQQFPLAPMQIDKGADSIWASLLKTQTYKEQLIQDDHASQSIDEGGLYLRYYDKKDNTLPTPDYELSYVEALADSIQYTDKQIYILANRYRGCVNEASYDTDSLVQENPAVTIGHARLKTIQQRLNNCLAKADRFYGGDLTAPKTAYQSYDINLIKHCSANYTTNLKNALSSNRAIARYEGADYDRYDSVYGNFAVCYANFEMGYRLDPVYYTEEGYGKDKLEITHETRLCAIDNANAQAQLATQGKTYTTDPKAYEALFYEYLGCLNGKFAKVYDGAEGTLINSPKDMREARTAFEMHQELLASLNEESLEQDSWLSSYLKMKESQAQVDLATSVGIDGTYGEMANQLLQLMKRTPEQVLANNLYQYNHSYWTVLSHHKPATKTISSVIHFEFDSPTAHQSIYVPVYADFNKDQLITDISPALPALAFIDSNHTPILTDTLGKLYLPKELAIIPMSVIYDAIWQGYQKAFASLEEGRFAYIAPKSAPFYEEFGGTSVIKLTLTSKDTGQMLGVVAKELERALSAYIENNPKLFETIHNDLVDVAEDVKQRKQNAYKDRLKDFVKQWTLINQGHHVRDVGNAMQLIEAILSIGIDQQVYFYLDNGKLLAQVAKTDIGNSLTASQDELLTLVSFREADFYKHKLARHVLTQSKLPKKPFDINEWLTTLKQHRQHKKDAENARWAYDVEETITGLDGEEDDVIW